MMTPALSVQGVESPPGGCALGKPDRRAGKLPCALRVITQRSDDLTPSPASRGGVPPKSWPRVCQMPARRAAPARPAARSSAMPGGWPRPRPASAAGWASGKPPGSCPGDRRSESGPRNRPRTAPPCRIGAGAEGRRGTCPRPDGGGPPVATAAGPLSYSGYAIQKRQAAPLPVRAAPGDRAPVGPPVRHQDPAPPPGAEMSPRGPNAANGPGGSKQADPLGIICLQITIWNR